MAILLFLWLACTGSTPPLDVGVHAERKGDVVVISMMNGDSEIVEGQHHLEALTVSPGQIARVDEVLNTATVHVEGVPPDAMVLQLGGTLVVSTPGGERSAKLPKEARIWGAQQP